MSIQSTQTVDRSFAIDRIIQIDELARDSNYRAIGNVSNESSDCSLSDFVDEYDGPLYKIEFIHKWTNSMLSEVLSLPFSECPTLTTTEL